MINSGVSAEWARLDPEIQERIKSFQTEYPVKVGAIAKSFGLDVKKATLQPKVSGEIRKQGAGYIIRVNRHDASYRQRFTLAHEIAHFLLHEEYIGDGIVDDMLYRSNLSNAMEAEANSLAADIIMPRNLVMASKQIHDSLPKELRLEKIAHDLGVSTVALKYRLGE